MCPGFYTYMAYNESMPFEDDKSKELLTDLGLALAGGTGAVGGLASNDWLSKNIKGLDDWESLTKSVWNTKPFTSAHTGKALQVSPEVADKVLDTYVTGAQRLASQKVGPWRVGNIIGNVGLLPYNIKSLFNGKADPAAQSMRDSYALFSDPVSTKEALKTRMLDRARHSSYLDDTRGQEMRAAFDALSDDVKAILEKHPTSIKDKYDALAKLKNKAGLDYMENFILGHGKSHPGAVKLVGGGVIGDVKGGKLVDEVLHPGFAKNYIHKFRKPLQAAKALSKFGIGGAAAAAGLGLAGLGKTLGESINKSASVVSEDSPEALAKLLGGSGLLALSGEGTVNSVKELIENGKKAPNMNIGFSYGDFPQTGDGHKAPAVHMRNILESYINSLPEGHELKGTTVLDEFGKPIANAYGGFKRKGGVQFHDIGSKVHGSDPSLAKDFNIVYNTGLGLAIPHPTGQHGNKKYGIDVADKLRGTTQSIRNYITDTPHTIAGVPFAGSTVAMPVPKIKLPWMDHPLRNGTGYGYFGIDSKTLGYGDIPKALHALHATPLIVGSLHNIAPDLVGTPLINPTVLDNLNKYTTKDQKLARLQEIINTAEFDDPEVKTKLQKIHDAIKKGKKVVTVAGSGTGAYVGSRTAHLLDSFDRLGVSDVEVVPLAANYTSANLASDARKKLIDNLERMDKNKRVTAFGRLKNEPYTLLQQLADINMASTGQMAISESANFGNLQFIPGGDGWRDLADHDKLHDFRSSLWTDALGANAPAERERFKELFKHSTPWLQVVNKGSIEAMPSQMGDVFKQFGHYEGPAREGVLNYLRAYGASEDTLRKPIIQQFDTDGIAELLLDKNKDLLADLSRKASEAAAANRAKIPEAHKALVDDMVGTIKRNVRLQKLKGLPGAIGGALGSGLGLYGMYSGIKQMMSPKNFSLNLS